MQLQSISPKGLPTLQDYGNMSPHYQETLDKVKNLVGGEEAFNQLPHLDFSNQLFEFPELSSLQSPILKGIDVNRQVCLILRFEDKNLAVFVQRDPTLNGWCKTFVDYGINQVRRVPLAANETFVQALIKARRQSIEMLEVPSD